MSFAIMRLEKRNAGNITGMFIHNERKSENHSNEDIDVEKSYLNYQLIECDSYKQAINEQIEKRYKQNRNIRVDAVLGVEVVFTSDNDFFKNLTEEEERKYFEKSLEFLKNAVGEENVISATVHKDESTPHMHCVFVPIDSQGRLRYKSFVNGRNDLIKLQDEYYNYITQDFKNLERGKNSKETKRKHLDVEEYKIESRRKSVELKLEELNSRELELNQKEQQFKEIDKDIEIFNNATLFNSGDCLIRKENLEIIKELLRISRLKEIEEKKKNEKLQAELEEVEANNELLERELKRTSEKENEYKMKLVKLISKNDRMKKELAIIDEKENYKKILKNLEKDSQNMSELFESFLNEIEKENKEMSEVLREKYKNEWKEKTLYSDIVDSEIRINEINYNIDFKYEEYFEDDSVAESERKLDISNEEEKLLLEKILLISKIEIYEQEIEKMGEFEKDKYIDKIDDLREKKNQYEGMLSEFDSDTTLKLFSKLIHAKNNLIEENKKYSELRKELSDSSVPLSSEQSRELTKKIVANNRKIKVINVAIKNVNSKMKESNENIVLAKARNNKYLNDTLNRTDNKNVIRVLGIDRIVITDEETDIEEKEAMRILGKDYREVRGRERRGRGRGR